MEIQDSGLFLVRKSNGLLAQLQVLVTITEIMVLFLSVDSNKEINDLIRLLCLLGKYHIHKARFLQFIPSVILFHIELKTFYESVCKVPKNKKAFKTSSLLKEIIKCIARWNIAPVNYLTHLSTFMNLCWNIYCYFF